jgi:UDP-N-acetylglucosamine 3-dehydrogenase
VLVEKPLALTVAECDALIRASTRYGRSLGVSHNELFYPAHERAKALIESGDLGEPLLLRLRLAADGPYGGWRSHTAQTGGGILFDAGVHRLYVALALFGEISDVHALLDRSQKEGEEFALLGLTFASGARGIVEANFLSPARYFDDSIEIVCSAGGLLIAGIESQYVGFRSGPPLLRFEDGRWREEVVSSGGWEESIDRSVDAFLVSVANDLPPPVSAANGREVIALLEKIYLKAELWGGRER